MNPLRRFMAAMQPGALAYYKERMHYTAARELGNMLRPPLRNWRRYLLRRETLLRQRRAR